VRPFAAVDRDLVGRRRSVSADETLYICGTRGPLRIDVMINKNGGVFGIGLANYKVTYLPTVVVAATPHGSSFILTHLFSGSNQWPNSVPNSLKAAANRHRSLLRVSALAQYD
jgi:hypothetical protein